MPGFLQLGRHSLQYNRRELPFPAVPDYASYLSRILTASWVPYQQSFRDLRRNAADITNAEYFNTGSLSRYGIGRLPAVRLFGTNTGLGTAGYARAASATRFDTEAAGGCAVWFSIDTLPSGATDNMTLAARTAVTTNDGATLYVAYDGGAIRLACDLTLAGAATTLMGGQTLVANRLYHAAVVWRASGLSELYLDGLQIDTEAASPAFTMSGANVYIGANINVGGGFFTALTGRVVRADWFSTAPGVGDIDLLSRDVSAGYRTSRRFVFFTTENPAPPTEAVVSANDLMWAGTFARDPQEAQTVYWTGSFLRADSIAASTAATMTQTVAWSQACDREPQVAHTLTWTGDAATVSFRAPDNFARDLDTLTWSGQFLTDDSDLANLRYRR